MNLVLTQSSEVWLATNETIWCNRMAAALSTVACEQNRNHPFKGRCFGCGGLHDQSTPPKQKEIEGLDALDTIIDDLYEDPVPGDDFADIELDVDDEMLLALFPELARDGDAAPLNYQRFTEYQEAVKPRAVYRGRCKRCLGYMEDVREWHDDYVFHCLECGWRTSPEYERNRAIQAAGGVICE
ncbi:MAG TPA: hypothetical protein VGJ93_15560 [Desulfuromonadaceae bacterium]|jgi:hypothetical protein